MVNQNEENEVSPVLSVVILLAFIGIFALVIIYAPGVTTTSIGLPGRRFGRGGRGGRGGGGGRPLFNIRL